MSNLMDIHATPAYGRDYRTFKATLQAFLGGHDFRMNTPTLCTYFSCRDLKSLHRDGYGDVVFLFNGRTEKKAVPISELLNELEWSPSE